MPAPLDSFIACQIVTLKEAGFSYQKIADELGLKAKSTAQSVFRRFNKNKLFTKKNPLVVLQSYRKKPKETWSKMFSKIPKQLWREFGLNTIPFRPKNQFREQLRRILRKHGVFSRVAAKKISIKNVCCFSVKMVTKNDLKFS